MQNNAPYLPDDNVINLSDLLLFIESYPYQHKMQKATLDKIKKKIERHVSNISHEEHVENSMKDNNNPYDSKEEQRVITGSEQDTAKKLGKLKEGQKTRTNHSGNLIVTEDVTSSIFLRLPGQLEDESMDVFVVRP